MRRRSWPLGIVVSATLVLLVGVLAWLQYSWLGEVSEAERTRLQSVLRQRANEFADDFDREITRAYLSFQIDEASWGRDPAALAARYDAWRQNSRAPQLVRAIYLVDADAIDTIQEYRPNDRAFRDVTWPPELAPVRERLTSVDTASAARPLEGVPSIRDPIVAGVPALVLPVTRIQTLEAGPVRNLANLHLGGKTVIVAFDREYLQSTFLPALAQRYFPEEGIDTYRFAVVDAHDLSNRIFARGLPPGASINPAKADASVGLFSFRFDLTDQIAGIPRTAVFGSSGTITYGAVNRQSGRAASKQATDSSRGRFSIFVEQRTTGTAGRRGEPGNRSADVLKANVRMLAPAAWQLVLQHPAGSLEAAVQQARRRNLGLSFGILALLAASVVLIVANAQRSQRLAVQQMDFVATVSHELRTPLAVIRSAAQNLSAGVVHDSAQTKRYGDLIDTEGRRLTDMVEQVLEYAGLSGNRRPRAAAPTNVADIVRDLVESSRPLFESEHVEAVVTIERDLPLVLADEGGIRRALQNLLTNALKYGATGGWIGVDARRSTARGVAEVQITVSDRGRGIESADLPHIFEPFYRGVHPLEQQIHGNGLGLSMVKRIVEAHGGRVTVKSTPGEGAAFTIRLRGTEVFSTESASSVPEVPGARARSNSGT